MKKADKTRIALSYGTDVCVLPGAAIEYIDKAKKFDIKVLMHLCSAERFRAEGGIALLAKELSCEEGDVSASIAFWRGAGIVSIDEDQSASSVDTKAESPAADEATVVPKRTKLSELPQYTSSELNALLEKHRHVVELIDECQNVLGKIFTAADIKVLMALVDYLGLDNDYILVLMHYAARVDMRSLRYIEKMAVSCLDDGFTDARELQSELRSREERASLEGKIRNAFGIGGRKLTSKEKKCVEAWITNFKYDIDVIEKAYEITVSATSKPSIPYANAILEKWFAEGARDIDGVNAILEAREQEKKEDGSSFNVDEFFDAALKRSYSDKK